MSDIAAKRSRETEALRRQLGEARDLYGAMLAEMNRLRAALTEITELELEGDAVAIAEQALNPAPPR